MEGRKEIPRPWPGPPPPKQQEKRIPVVYYLSKNHHLEHPHYIEVPISSSEGLYLKDVIHRLVLLRGKNMPTMYSWSCKRSYKNGFVWHDLSEDDLIFPTNGKDYVLKGSEILDRTPSEHNGDKLKFDIPKQYQQDSHAFTRTQEPLSSSSSSPSTVNASTQTDNGDSRKPNGRRRSEEMLRLPLASSPSSCVMTDTTLESLIKADARKVSNFRILEEEQVFVPVKAKSKAANLLVQLISCGAISAKGHQSFPKPKFSPKNFHSPMSTGSTGMIREFDSPLDNSWRFRGLRMNEKDYFSGSLLETTINKEGIGEGIPVILRSSSCKENRCCNSPQPKEEEYKHFDSPGSKCFPRTRRVTTLKSCRNEALISPSSGYGQSRVLGSSHYGNNRITDSSSVRGSVIRLGSFREDESDQE
ncbi:Protein SOSEKI 2 plant protein [Dioscorea alata]|uniref:Protein SOSEKI 2 plant protein n=3 Tax=Dioscorea alata TaxID=55571 RepID=A0ACB7WT78_DIOAL|nr:Protein SOSEKI 2 plant protein [Dioscorea alata]KAH7691703.1 Protein SOSEKI 2 plant protein [Dioscorea alata]KAH7691704.1 Protein SOSEKI 2 plant protein [Dioscorea alata]